MTDENIEFILEQWLGIHKEAALSINPNTCEVDWEFGDICDPYRIYPDIDTAVGRNYFAFNPGSDIWVSFDDLSDEISAKIWANRRCKGERQR